MAAPSLRSNAVFGPGLPLRAQHCELRVALRGQRIYNRPSVMHEPIAFWVVFNAFVLLLLVLDLGVFQRRPHAIRFREAMLTSLMWIALAGAFAAGVYWYRGRASALEFVTGYLVEESLSVDNLFVFLLIFRYFRVPGAYQHKVLFWGILGALIMRGIFIVVGVSLIRNFHWVIYLFGAFLVYTGL